MPDIFQLWLMYKILHSSLGLDWCFSDMTVFHGFQGWIAFVVNSHLFILKSVNGDLSPSASLETSGGNNHFEQEKSDPVGFKVTRWPRSM